MLGSMVAKPVTSVVRLSFASGVSGERERRERINGRWASSLQTYFKTLIPSVGE